jgi:hypothetical protein
MREAIDAINKWREEVFYHFSELMIKVIKNIKVSVTIGLILYCLKK